ncbi:MAG: MoaD/ThiS family protein [Planctomycetota bacterium]
MVRVCFTKNIQRHVACPPCEVASGTARQVLDAAFAPNEKARLYVLDEQGAVRKHMVVFINGEPVKDRVRLGDAVPDGAEVYVMQALSGG